MPPKSESEDMEGGGAPIIENLPSNEDLMEDARKVTMDEAQMWGKVILNDFRTTVGTHWLSVRRVKVSPVCFKLPEDMTLNTAWVGVAYSLIGGMPICIFGSTGPALAFTTVLYKMSKSLDIPFYTLYAWVSVWLLIYAVVVAFIDLTCIVCMATRFTDKIFALLIVSIFIIKAIGDPFGDGGILRFLDPDHDSHKDQEEDYTFLSSALLSILLGFGTTLLIFWFRSFKTLFFCSNGYPDLDP